MRYLFGPVNATFADSFLAGPRREGRCVTFGGEGTDLPCDADTTREALWARMPSGWQPDCVVLWPAYSTVPFWSAPVPVIAAAADWNLLWHVYRHTLPRCDAVLTDSAGVDVCTRAGIVARQAILYGLGHEWFEDAPAVERDIDVLFVGNLSAAVQGERLPWLDRLASVSPRWKVRIASGVFGAEYRALMRRARVVFNRSTRGEANQRAFEAIAAGAVLFQEADNREVPALLTPNEEFVPYADDLEAKLAQLLGDEPSRLRIAEAGHAKARQFTFATLFEPALERILAELPSRPPRLAEPLPLSARLWQRACQHGPGGETDITPELSAPEAAFARGMLETDAASAAQHFRKAHPSPVTLLSLAESLLAAGEDAEAAHTCRRLLGTLDRSVTLEELLLPRWPAAYDHFRVTWERAAWSNVGDSAAEAQAKTELLRGRAQQLLASLTGALHHYHEAAFALPTCPPARAALGCALARAGHFPEALHHLRFAVHTNPLDNQAARALAQLLSETGESRRELELQRAAWSRVCPQAVPAEGWFAGADPCLVSIIIPCFNESAATRVCLESVFRHTREPFEVIVVDNGSTDDTPALLSRMRCEVIHNEENRGFAVAINQGLARAKGEWVVLLNNDTAVTAGWIEGMLAARGDKVGLVGPVSNNAPEPQFVPAGYADLSGLNAFAAAHAKRMGGQVLEVERLTGFCLMARRETLARVGVLDEQFGVGFFEDDDLCVRVKKAGWGLRVATSVFVHHEGSHTFRALGMDTETMLRENFQRFHDKWGEEESSRYRLPDGSRPLTKAPGVSPERLPPRSDGRPTVSLCVIAKNEEDNIAACLAGWSETVDEIVVVDTGSTDRTRELAASLGAKVSLFPWVDSFAAARNASLDAATGEYVFWMDADDRIDDINREKLKTLLATLDGANVAYVVKCRCVAAEPGGTETVVDHVRLFRKDAHRWKYRIHEQILPALRATDTDVRFSDVEVRHVGYVDPALRGRKLERDLRLLEMEDREHPDDPFTLFNLGQVYQELRRTEPALACLRRSLERSHPRDSIVRKLYALIASCLTQLGRMDEALAACVAGREHYPDDAELLFRHGTLLGETGQVPQGIEVLTRLVEGTEGAHFASVAGGLRGHLGRHHLADLLMRAKRHAEAETQWRRALLEEPEFLPGLLGLGELHLNRQNWSALEGVVEQVRRRSPLEAETLRGRGQIGRKEFAAARWTLSQLAEAHPDALWPRVFLTHALLQEGQDWRAAERALLDVLRLDPHHAQARGNLDLLRREHGVGIS